jgi:hypothetical protein
MDYLISETTVYESVSNDNISIGSYFTSNAEYIAYYKAKSDNWTNGIYQGTGASGNFIETGKKPRRVIIKRIDSTGSWYVTDGERPLGGPSVAEFLELNTSDDKEVASNFELYYESNGFTVGNTNTNVNASNGQYYYEVWFDTNGTNDDSYFDLPTDDSNLNITNGQFVYTDGIGSNGYNLSVDTFTGSLDFTGVTDGVKWVGKEKGSNTIQAFDTKPTYPIGGNLSFLPNPIMVASETPIDIRYEDKLMNTYVDSISADSIECDNIRGKNSCTAWVNFDGTTTPPTIRDGYNVASVVRTATGRFDIYFEEEMDNNDYSYNTTINGGGGDETTFGDRWSNGYNPLTNKISIMAWRDYDRTYANQSSMNIQIFGGKNV